MTDEINAGMGWNEEEIARGKREEEERLANQSADRIFRYRVKKGGEGKVTFVAAKPYFMREHQFEWQGDLYTFEVSPQGTLKPGEEDLLEKMFGEAHRVWLFLAIDHVPYTSKKGKTYTDRLKFVPVKLGDIEFFKKMRDSFGKGSMLGLSFDVMRSTQQMSSTIGDKWIPTGTMTDAELRAKYPDAMKLVDDLLANDSEKLRKMFAPKTAEQIKAKYGNSGGGSGAPRQVDPNQPSSPKSGAFEDGDDEIPF